MQEQIDNELNKIKRSKIRIKEIYVNNFIEQLDYTSQKDVIGIFLTWLLKKDEANFLSSILKPSNHQSSSSVVAANSRQQCKDFYLIDILKSNEFQKLDVLKSIFIQNKDKNENVNMYINLIDILIEKYRIEWSKQSYEKSDLENIIFKILNDTIQRKRSSSDSFSNNSKRSKK